MEEERKSEGAKKKKKKKKEKELIQQLQVNTLYKVNPFMFLLTLYAKQI